MLAAALVLLGPLRARAAKEVDIYYGVGNFFHLQHELVYKEALDFSRREGDITAVAGYAGGKTAGDLDRVCYSGLAGSPDHVALGHTQVVRVTLPEESVTDFTRFFLDEVPKRKVFDTGNQYRPVIGIRGGFQSPLFSRIAEAAEGRVELVKGTGNDPDTLGPKASEVQKPTIYLYDAKSFPFRMAEVQNQYRNCPPEVYTNDYRELNEKLKKIGTISSNGCP